MSEKPGYDPTKESDEGMTRADFLKFGLGLVGMGVAAKLGMDRLQQSEQPLDVEAENEMLKSATEKVFIDAPQVGERAMTITDLRERGGWPNEHENEFIDVLYRFNGPQKFGKDGKTLQPLTEYIIPMKGEK